MPWLFPFLCAPPLAYLSVVGALAVGQRRLIYRPTKDYAPPFAAGAPWMTEVRRGETLLGWYAPPPTPEAPVLVFFHGNSGTLARIAQKMAPWREWGIGLFAATYRGFECNRGRPHEAGLYADGRTALDWLEREGVEPARQILYGESLGTGIATHLAVERPVRALVLEAPYVSMPEVAAQHYPWTPARFLVRDRFDTLGKIAYVRSPMLILHGEADHTIPVDHSRRLAAAATAWARLEVLPGADHVDLYEHGAEEILGRFVGALGENSSD